MSTLRRHGEKWQSIVRVSGHPAIYNSFKSKTDATRWAAITEVKLRRENAGIVKIKFPKFEDVARRYIEEVSIHKKGDHSGMRQIKKTLHDDYKRSGGKWMSDEEKKMIGKHTLPEPIKLNLEPITKG